MKNAPTLWRLAKILCLCLLTAGVVFYASPSQAVEMGASIMPTPLADDKRASFDLIASEGQTVEDTAIVRNTGTKTAKIFVFPSGYELKDGKITETPVLEDAPEEPGKWIEMDEQEFTLVPQEARIVGFKVHVPEKADVGEHVPVLLAQAVSTETGGEGSGLHINIRTGVRVYVTVPGDVNRDMTIQSIGHRIVPFWKLFTKDLKFLVKLRNGGNVTLRPEVNLRIKGFFGEVGYQEKAQYGKVMRETERTVEHKWVKRAPYFGRFVAEFDIHLGEQRQVNKDGTKTMLPDQVIQGRYVFWVFPWIEIIYLIGLIFLLYLLRTTWLYFVIINRLKTKTESYTVAQGDNLTKIGAKLGIKPKTLVRFNMIPWPYEVEPGDKLLIPVGKFAGGEWRNRVGIVFQDRDIRRGVWGHLFRKKNVHELTHKHIQPSAQASGKVQIVVVEAGDTIDDVAKFAGTDKGTLVGLNKLRPPYCLKAGQEIRIPTGTGYRFIKKTTRRRKK